MKLVVLYILAVPLAALVFSGASVVLGTAKASILNPGPHGLSEVVYAFTSAANNNGSAFGGLNAATAWYTTTLGLAMLVGRFLLIIPLLAIAGSLAAKQPAPHQQARCRRTARSSRACSSGLWSSSSA